MSAAAGALPLQQLPLPGHCICTWHPLLEAFPCVLSQCRALHLRDFSLGSLQMMGLGSSSLTGWRVSLTWGVLVVMVVMGWR